MAGKTSSDNLGSKFVDFVVKEIISKEGVKLPAYTVEEITSAVVKKLTGIKKAEIVSPWQGKKRRPITIKAHAIEKTITLSFTISFEILSSYTNKIYIKW